MWPVQKLTDFCTSFLKTACFSSFIVDSLVHMQIFLPDVSHVIPFNLCCYGLLIAAFTWPLCYPSFELCHFEMENKGLGCWRWGRTDVPRKKHRVLRGLDPYWFTSTLTPLSIQAASGVSCSTLLHSSLSLLCLLSPRALWWSPCSPAAEGASSHWAFSVRVCPSGSGRDHSPAPVPLSLPPPPPQDLDDVWSGAARVPARSAFVAPHTSF